MLMRLARSGPPARPPAGARARAPKRPDRGARSGVAADRSAHERAACPQRYNPRRADRPRSKDMQAMARHVSLVILLAAVASAQSQPVPQRRGRLPADPNRPAPGALAANPDP